MFDCFYDWFGLLIVCKVVCLIGFYVCLSFANWFYNFCVLYYVSICGFMGPGVLFVPEISEYLRMVQSSLPLCSLVY